MTLQFLFSQISESFQTPILKWISEPFELKKITCIALLSIIIVPALSGHGISESDRQAMLSGGIPEYIWLGASHMLTGYDHQLFIFGIIFFLNNFKDIFKYITIFTLGHSITLLVATFVNYRPLKKAACGITEIR